MIRDKYRDEEDYYSSSSSSSSSTYSDYENDDLLEISHDFSYSGDCILNDSCSKYNLRPRKTRLLTLPSSYANETVESFVSRFKN